tara:strand:+ start:150 stop:1511 length:1362 start_codon:yes stop_codon:yes gene_type:complete
MIKILATIGPETNNIDSITFISKYSKLLRLNGSHADHKWHSDTVRKIREVRSDAIILLDIPGIKPRTNNKSNLEIEKGQEVDFYYGKEILEGGIPLTRQLPLCKKIPSTFSLNDGQHFFKTVSLTENLVKGISLSSFSLKTKKGLNIPGGEYDDNVQRDYILNFLNDFDNLEVDAYGVSFVQNASIIKELKSAYPEKIIISKIESSQGLLNIEEICDESDVIMIDRGDLAAEIGVENLYKGVTKISACCKRHGKSLIIATENLSTMISISQPTKSDVISLGHSINVGADCIMLSEETAISSEYRNIIIWLYNFLKNSMPYMPTLSKGSVWKDKGDLMWSIIDNLQKDMPFIVSSRTGKAMQKVLSCGFEDVHLITDSEKTSKLGFFYRQEIIITIDLEFKLKVPSKLIYDYVKSNIELIFAKNSIALSTFVSEPFKGALADNITFIDKKRLNL